MRWDEPTDGTPLVYGDTEAPCALGRAFIIDEAQDITRVCSPHIEMSPSAEAGEPLQGIHLSFILSIFLVVFRWL